MTRIALITGANRGLGRSTALHLAESGTDLILTYRSHADEAEAVVEAARKLGRTAIALRLDTADTATFPAFTAQVREALARSGAATLSTSSSTTPDTACTHRSKRPPRSSSTG